MIDIYNWFLGILFYSFLVYCFWIIGKALDEIKDDLSSIKVKVSTFDNRLKKINDILEREGKQ